MLYLKIYQYFDTMMIIMVFMYPHVKWMVECVEKKSSIFCIIFNQKCCMHVAIPFENVLSWGILNSRPCYTNWSVCG